MRSAFFVLCLLLGCAPVDESVNVTRSEILGGAAAAQESSVFLLDLRFDNGASICSAVLVSPRVLLTAAHCVDPAFRGASSVSIRAMNKPDVVNLMQSETIEVTTVSRHPQWNPSDQESAFDFAALLLERAPVGVTPSLLARGAPVNGAMLRVVGYGRAGANDGASSGVRRAVTTPITQVSAAEFEFGTNGGVGICAGDSGGPSFIGNTVVGIHSRTESASCGRGVDMRVDARLAFVEAFIAANDAPTCAQDGRCAANCSTPDLDCPCADDGTCNETCGTTDPDCSCGADGLCRSACGTTDPDCRCAADGRCEMTCGASDVDCPCTMDGACVAACGLSDVDCLDDGTPCADVTACLGGRCEHDPRGFEFCTRSCTADAECFYEMTCQSGVCRAKAEGDVVGGCVAAPGAWLLGVLLFLRRRAPITARRAAAPG